MSLTHASSTGPRRIERKRASADRGRICAQAFSSSTRGRRRPGPSSLTPMGRPSRTPDKRSRRFFRSPGWVEHDPESLWSSAVSTAREALRRAGCEPSALAAVGIANQRETALIWDRATGKPICNAIVWQDRRTAEACSALKASGCEPQVTAVTGLLLDPYFSATKIAWALDAAPGARAAAERGELAFGTVDSFLLWRLTNGALHATDATNASRTMLYDIRKGEWDDDMLRLFNVPASILPEVRDTAAEFGVSASEHLGAAVPIRALIGDQQSALIGQACVAPGMVKATYGTGGFLLLNTGETPTPSGNRLLTTVAYQWRGLRAYALEGSIFSAGATVQWLRDGLNIIAKAAEAGELAAASDRAQSVYCVPAFAGLGAPHWNSEARALLQRHHPRNDPQRDRPGGARERRLPDPRPRRGDEIGLGRRNRRHSRRRRDGGERLDHAVSGRHPRRSRRPAEGLGIDRARCSLRRRLAGRALSWTRVLRRKAQKGPALHTAHGRRDARATVSGLAGGGAEGARKSTPASRSAPCWRNYPTSALALLKTKKGFQRVRRKNCNFCRRNRLLGPGGEELKTQRKDLKAKAQGNESRPQGNESQAQGNENR